jgi:hypothetical protein
MRAYTCHVAAAVLVETVRGQKTRESGKGREETVAVTRERVVRVGTEKIGELSRFVLHRQGGQFGLDARQCARPRRKAVRQGFGLVLFAAEVGSEQSFPSNPRSLLMSSQRYVEREFSP